MATINTNEKFVESRLKIGRRTTLAAMLLIGGSLAFYLPRIFSGAQNIPTNELLLLYAVMFGAIILSNVGGYYMSRYSTKDYDKVGAALKGLDKNYRMYNFLLPAPHVLLGPAGVTVLLLKNQDGQITADAKGWKQPGSITRFLRSFSSEALGNPPEELEGLEVKMRALMTTKLGPDFQVPVDGYVIFTSPRARVNTLDIAEPVIALSQDADALKNAIRRDKRAVRALPKADYDKIYALFEQTAQEKIAESGRNWLSFRR